MAERVWNTISLGLETLLVQPEPDCPPDGAAVAKSADLLGVWCMTDLFRYDFGATLLLR